MAFGDGYLPAIPRILTVSAVVIAVLFGIRAARSTVVVIAVVAVFLAGDPNSSAFGIISFAWAGFDAV